ncbi:MAG: hypothetical protein JWO00_394 [Candidatus Parcubacteria bacterium]|nr:hypothetical protein [Candidatus Parcubacteria bacterium]
MDLHTKPNRRMIQYSDHQISATHVLHIVQIRIFCLIRSDSRDPIEFKDLYPSDTIKRLAQGKHSLPELFRRAGKGVS